MYHYRNNYNKNNKGEVEYDGRNPLEPERTTVISRLFEVLQIIRFSQTSSSVLLPKKVVSQVQRMVYLTYSVHHDV